MTATAVLLAIALAGQAGVVLPESALPLTLTGVVVDAVPAKALALVRCNAGEGEARVAMVPPGGVACGLATVDAVRDDGVEITNLGSRRREHLAFRREAVALAGQVPAIPGPQASDAPPVAVRATVSAAVLSRYLLNPSDLLTAAVAVPHYVDLPLGAHVMDGFEISRVAPDGVVAQIGLKDGDVIQEVNGARMDGPDAVFRLMGQTLDFTHTTVVVSRKGQRVVLELDAR